MSDTAPVYDDIEDDEATAPPVQQDGNKEIKALRRAAEEGKKAKREAAFLRAGIDPDDTRMSYFVKGYDGELDPSAIKQAAIEAGFLSEQAPQQDAAAQQAQQGQQRIMQAAEGSVPQYDENGALMALDKAYKEGGAAAVLQVAQQYGLPVGAMPGRMAD